MANVETSATRLLNGCKVSPYFFDGGLPWPPLLPPVPPPVLPPLLPGGVPDCPGGTFVGPAAGLTLPVPPPPLPDCVDCGDTTGVAVGNTVPRRVDVTVTVVVMAPVGVGVGVGVGVEVNVGLGAAWSMLVPIGVIVGVGVGVPPLRPA